MKRFCHLQGLTKYADLLFGNVNKILAYMFILHLILQLNLLQFCLSLPLSMAIPWFFTFSEPKYYDLGCLGTFYVFWKVNWNSLNLISNPLPSSLIVMPCVPHRNLFTCDDEPYVFCPLYSSETSDLFNFLPLCLSIWMCPALVLLLLS